MKLSTLLDARAYLPNRIRAVIVIIAGIAALIGQIIDDLEAAGWAVTLPVALAILGHFTRLGDESGSGTAPR